ncbi:MAG: pyridoxamine 5'-phosphate oxidase family protein [Clostridiales bacterium]|nr:pyridoxamine 5'-phosphate oxidase family protein [Clostridiales bacterium]
MKGEPYPYVVPLSYGFELQNDRNEIRIYIHGAIEGFKNDLLARDNRVCVEFDIFHRNTLTDMNITTEYESVIGFGKAVLAGGDEAIKGLDLILAHCGFAGFEYDHAVADVTRVYRVELYEVIGKRWFVK